MSYLALARKWRPKTFADVVGQEHIVRALKNALESERVHHAYLFAGTRGVGKTTVARILAKALNCEAGVKGEPCGKCGACVSIDEGRFVDLIEVDAASRTKVDDTRELLENVQYTPTNGRYKVYLIDEVHMLSNHSFNALLKTLEEPPPHVKFLLATTDPQKLPVTVLSRCLQFNLKRLSTTQIVDRMSYIGSQEKIKSEAAALTRIARAARGSMRDALSLLDQALAFGDGEILDADVASMLGSMDRRHINEMIEGLIAADAAALIERIRALQELVPDYESVLDDLATVFQQIAVVQLAGVDALDEDAEVESLQQFATALSADLVQLYYQIAVAGRRDLGLAPDPRVGFEMTLLRMIAFQPAGAVPVGAAMPPAAAATGSSSSSGSSKGGMGGMGDKGGGSTGVAAATDQTQQAAGSATADWEGIIARMKLKGAVRQLAQCCAIGELTEPSIQLDIHASSEYLLSEKQKQALTDAIKAGLGEAFKVSFQIVEDELDTISSRKVDASTQQMQAAKDSIKNDPNVHQLMEMFDATVEADSIRPVNQQGEPR
jgi:DNA polymerase-3 subunit gamma/tau